ncbi:DUF502 domain-containing protein [Brevibacillus daliensis]|uniref:DUF502 domain-containing protein n=1 Tax=Brevibacillus daliensis TaxID=2892995 RepID=UPI001E5413E7|nr:DUF502 domain-containing protein [Brevibacillus daliensis]
MIRYFFEGLLLVVPLAATIYILYLVFTTIDNLLPLKIPGLGFLVTLAIIWIIGFLTSNVLTKSIIGLVDKLFTKLPFVKLIYSAIKDVIGAFVGDKKSFDKPVLVRLSMGSEARVLGFITRESLKDFGLEDFVSVYVPQSYNFAGNLLIFPRNQVEILDAESSQVMTFILSGGVSGKEQSEQTDVGGKHDKSVSL